MTSDVTPTLGRDLGVLKAVYARLQGAAWVDMPQLVTDTGLDSDTIDQIVKVWIKENALDAAGITVSGDPDELGLGRESQTGRGLRLVGAWPAPERMPIIFISALEEIAQQSADPKARGWVRDMIDRWSGPEGTKALVEIFGQLVRQGWFPGS